MTSLVRPVAAAQPWAEPLTTHGVTGTNGKTSTCALLAACLGAAGRDVLWVGTTGAYRNGAAVAKGKTFAEFLTMMEQAAAEGCRDVVVETTSFALQSGYAKKWRFDLGVFTNLSPDHLKTHGTWENYLAAKAQLFLHLGPGRPMVLNAADPYAVYIHRATPDDVRRLWFRAPTRGPAQVPADLEADTIEIDASGTRVTLVPSPLADALGGALEVRMIGDIFAENALAAACAAWAAGIEPSAIVRGLAECPVVPGRFERLAVDPLVIVDYAHSPDALVRTCATARQLARGRVILVFGGGGNSTPEKRRPMGAAAAAGADVVIITNDNPRGEDPRQIAAMIQQGAVAAGTAASIDIVLDRREAIERAIAQATADDVVVIAGKGHEVGQHMGSTIVPFSDRDEVLRITAGA